MVIFHKCWVFNVRTSAEKAWFSVIMFNSHSPASGRNLHCWICIVEQLHRCSRRSPGRHNASTAPGSCSLHLCPCRNLNVTFYKGTDRRFKLTVLRCDDRTKRVTGRNSKPRLKAEFSTASSEYCMHLPSLSPKLRIIPRRQPRGTCFQ